MARHWYSVPPRERKETHVNLIYTPKPGMAAPPYGWPADDHTEPDIKTAKEKVKSGFFEEAKPPKKEVT